MAQAAKEKRVFNVKRISVDKDSRVQFEGNEYGYDNVNGVPAELKGVRFLDAATIAEARFADEATMQTAARREFNLKRQQRVKAYFTSDEALALFEAGKGAEAIANGRKLWDTYVYSLGAASTGTTKVKVSRTELQDLTAKAAKVSDLEAELAALKAKLGKK